MDRGQTLAKANVLINGQRKADYGELRKNFQTCADLWSTWLTARHGVKIDLTVEDVSIMNAMIKQARLANNIEYEDGWIDICGYAALGSELATEGQQELAIDGKSIRDIPDGMSGLSLPEKGSESFETIAKMHRDKVDMMNKQTAVK